MRSNTGFFRRRVVHEVTGSIARGLLLAAAAVARNVAKGIAVGEGKAVRLARFNRRVANLCRENGFGRELVSMIGRSETPFIGPLKYKRSQGG